MTTKSKILKRIVFLGPPGSGKGTQATLVSKKFNLTHVSTGEIFRKMLKCKSKLGSVIKKYITSGKLVPDKIVFKTIEPIIKRKKFLLDGFPRNLKQAKMLEKKLKKNNSNIEKVFYFNLSDKQVIKRLTSRRTCPSCGKNYNIYTIKPKKDRICDKCGSNLIIRDDDKISTVKKRLAIYKKETKPLVNFYKKIGLLKEIDASKTVEEINKDIIYAIRHN